MQSARRLPAGPLDLIAHFSLELGISLPVILGGNNVAWIKFKQNRYKMLYVAICSIYNDVSYIVCCKHMSLSL